MGVAIKLHCLTASIREVLESWTGSPPTGSRCKCLGKDHAAYWYAATTEYIITPAATAAARAPKVVAQVSTERSLW
ncbi:hypothetical protein NicSoilB8_01890 [Arthrobacter sp. NicSoilB8]|nr:hypothetical protein NicSoilB8_01890 [Arthrobacter sp. NicSoilB8]